MPFIVGTAGHIDHGKTALVKALTGQDTDRLKEEKERGISIDLGFAYMDVARRRVGIVDVPGHERFIRNMLAGAHGIDVVLLVVAADDGVMPQTEEHLDIVHLLGVRRGVVALTKVDLVDATRVEAVGEEIEILLAGTALEGSPVVPVSSVTGSGIDRLRAVLGERLAEHESAPARTDLFRLPIDRAFVLHGHGTVVTGTAVSGQVRPGDLLRVMPGGDEVRVRTVQVHEQEVREAARGQRVALNVAGAERSQYRRGQVLCTPERACLTDRVDALVEVRPAAKKAVKSHTSVRVYLGTAEVMGKVIWLDGRAEVAARSRAFAQLVLRDFVNAERGDRFIVRDGTAQRTLGGGTVVHPSARRHRRSEGEVSPRLSALREAVDPAAVVKALVALEESRAIEIDWLALAGGMAPERVRAAVEADATLIALPATAATACTTGERWARLQDAVVAGLGAFHQSQPLTPGMEMEPLRAVTAAELSPKIFRALIDALVDAKVIARQQNVLRLPSHRVELRRDEAAAASRAAALIVAGGVTPPGLKDIEKSVGVASAKLKPILKQLEREGRIAQVDSDLWFSSAAVEKARELVRAHASAHGQIDAATFRDLLGASRKFSIALLDYFDRTGFTMRVGDIRRLRKG